MAKFQGKNILFKDTQRAIFGDNNDAFIEWDEVGNQLEISTVISGVYPIEDHHLTTKYYVDSVISGSETFISLNDTPATYSGSVGYVVSVNELGTGLEFVAPGSFNVDGGRADSVYGGVPALDAGNA
jgi:hypothetical protein